MRRCLIALAVRGLVEGSRDRPTKLLRLVDPCAMSRVVEHGKAGVRKLHGGVSPQRGLRVNEVTVADNDGDGSGEALKGR